MAPQIGAILVLAMAFGNHALVTAFASTPDLKWDIVGLPRGKHRVNSG
ncbi:MAG: hypothetical protein HYY31_06180, partial [Chloroflexi bacterium]|nr:hypothetical protein [Chloroflexota bacterium]